MRRFKLALGFTAALDVKELTSLPLRLGLKGLVNFASQLIPTL